MVRFRSNRYLGLELAGAKNQKTTLAVLEYYPREKKVFLLEIISGLGGPESDESLLKLIGQLTDNTEKLAVNVPVGLPPCVTCTRKICPMPAKCTVPEVKWMRGTIKRVARERKNKLKGVAIKEFTPYTQRPVEIWLRYKLLPQIEPALRFDLDEALGGARAPLTARMSFLRRHLEVEVVETLPKLTISLLGSRAGLSHRHVRNYRDLQRGAVAREKILAEMAEEYGVFIYEKDAHKLARSLASFDAFICAFTAILIDAGRCAKPPASFPVNNGWIHYPEF